MRRFLLVTFIAVSARATTFLIPSDADLARAAKAIVVATAGESSGRRAPGGWIETVTALHVEESIKGPLAAGETIRVVELGGALGSTHYIVAGSPTYAPGERVLLFLDRNSRGEWVSRAMAVGKFSLRGEKAVRQELCGWNDDGTPHVEALRDAAKFVQFVRDAAKGDVVAAGVDTSVAAQAESPIAASDVKPSTYTLLWNGAQGNLGVRWNRFPSPVVFYSHGAQPGATSGGLTALQRALAAWTDDGASNVVYTYGGTTPVNAAGFAGNSGDGVNTILFDDPSDEIPGKFTGTGGDVLAIGGAWFDDASPAATHVFGSERFYTIYEGDVVVQNGIFGGGLTGNGFDRVLAHELGHTLGLRHSDTPPPGGTFSAAAVMTSSGAFNGDLYGANLQAWDREALAAIYGAAPVACKAPQITAQPQPSALAGAPVTLSVAASGDAPLHYQWYAGARDNTASPIAGATGASISVQPASTTLYWVRVSNGCPPAADSDAVAVTVNGCPPVSVDAISADMQIVQGTTVTLTAAATGATSFAWFADGRGSSAPFATTSVPSISVTPQTTTAYSMRASNGCGASALSESVVVAVIPCDAAAIAMQPTGGSVVAGSAATLYAGVAGSAPLTILWFEGERGDTSHPLPNGNSPTLTTPPLFAPASFWVRAANLCGSADSAAAAVSVVQSCSAPAIAAQPRDTAVPRGKTAALSVAATGTALTYQWYEGAVFDFTRPIGGSSPTLVTPPVQSPTQFWVHIGSACGSINSEVARVTVEVGRRRAAGR